MKMIYCIVKVDQSDKLGFIDEFQMRHLCKTQKHGGEAAGYDSPVGCQRYLTRTQVGHDLTSPLSVNVIAPQTQNFFQKF